MPLLYCDWRILGVLLHHLSKAQDWVATERIRLKLKSMSRVPTQVLFYSVSFGKRPPAFFFGIMAHL